MNEKPLLLIEAGIHPACSLGSRVRSFEYPAGK